jgi:hypothetical protein
MTIPVSMLSAAADSDKLDREKRDADVRCNHGFGILHRWVVVQVRQGVDFG